MATQEMSFSQVLREQLKSETTSASSLRTTLHEEEQTLWVQVLPYLKRENLNLKTKTRAYPRPKHTPKATAAPAPTPAPAPVKQVILSFLSINELDGLEIGQVELLIRKGWLKRQDTYELSEWKKAHRKAVKALHPDHAGQLHSDFSEIHESFKSLNRKFKPQAPAK